MNTPTLPPLGPLPTFEEWQKIIYPETPGTQVASLEAFMQSYATAYGAECARAAVAGAFPEVDEIAQFIRQADGKHQMGAGALAERLHEWLASTPPAIEADRAQRARGAMVSVNSGALQMVINALRRDSEEGRTSRGEMADELLATVEPADRAQRGVPDERDGLRADQAAAVMPLIGALLDAWDGLPNDLKLDEELSSVRRSLAEINHAMETAAPTAPQAVEQQAEQQVSQAAKDVLSIGDAGLLARAIDEIQEVNETAVSYKDLMRFASMGFLECVEFEVTPEAHAALQAFQDHYAARAAKQDQTGGGV